MAKKILSKDDVERLARVCWANTGDKAPVCPPGHQLVWEDTGKPVDPKELISVWEQVRVKDIFRRQAAAVAVELGFKLGDDVKVKPREMR